MDFFVLAPFSNVTCKVANDIFKEGEQFYAPDSCTECVCREGFQSEFVPPFCQRIKCLVQLDYAEMIAHRCAPVYLTKINGLLCCPTTFICRKSFAIKLPKIVFIYDFQRLLT